MWFGGLAELMDKHVPCCGCLLVVYAPCERGDCLVVFFCSNSPTQCRCRLGECTSKMQYGRILHNWNLFSQLESFYCFIGLLERCIFLPHLLIRCLQASGGPPTLRSSPTCMAIYQGSTTLIIRVLNHHQNHYGIWNVLCAFETITCQHHRANITFQEYNKPQLGRQNHLVQHCRAPWFWK